MQQQTSRLEGAAPAGAIVHEDLTSRVFMLSSVATSSSSASAP
jgi:hypothetical protein